MRPLSWGLPSTSLCSCFTSCCDIFRRSLCRKRAKGTSMAATTATTANRKPTPTDRDCPNCERPESRGRNNSVESSIRWADKKAQATAPITEVMNSSLMTSKSCCLEKIRPNPLSGLSRVRSGMRPLLLAVQPPAPIVAPTATNSTTMPKGRYTASPDVTEEARPWASTSDLRSDSWLKVN